MLLLKNSWKLDFNAIPSLRFSFSCINQGKRGKKLLGIFPVQKISSPSTNEIECKPLLFLKLGSKDGTQDWILWKSLKIFVYAIALVHTFLQRAEDVERKLNEILIYFMTAAVGQWVRVFAQQAEGCVLESQPQQT